MAENFFKTLAQDLLNLEVNTIVKSEMSAIKMPASRRQALFMVADEYREKLRELEVREPFHWPYAGINSFGELRDRANERMRLYEKDLPAAPPEKQENIRERIKMLDRIQAQSSQIVDMFEKLKHKAEKDKLEKKNRGYAKANERKGIEESNKKEIKNAAKPDMDSHIWNNDIDPSVMTKIEDLDLTPDQVTLIRKAWEIGTEKILLQTVIQLDGDVTTRIAESFLKDLNPTILRIHNEAIVTSTRFWSNLVKALGEIAGKAFGLILGK